MSNKTLDQGTLTPEYTPINQSVYEFMESRCRQYGQRQALSYYGKKITYTQMLQEIDRVAMALQQMGVQKGDTVVVALPSIPQAVYLFYAINKIGAIFCGMDCRLLAEEIADIVSHVKPKVCFVADFQLKEFSQIHSTQVVCISFVKAIKFLSDIGAFFADLFLGRKHVIAKRSHIRSYSKFLKGSAKHPALEDVTVKSEDICAYFYTSGTTKGRKCVVLSNENINSSVLQYSFSQADFKNAGHFCSIMPLFTCYGISLGTHLPLILGMKICMIPLFFGKDMKKLLLRYQPGYIITVPAHWDHFVTDKFDGVDLSFLRGAIVGGDKIDNNSEERLNEIFASCNSKAKVMRGYGLTEASTAVTTQPANTPKGSVGATLCWSEIGIFDPETGERLPTGEPGEICVCGPNICRGYLGDPKATADLLRRHPDGKIWLHSGDIGYMDEDGFLFFCERIKRMYVRFDGTKISPYAIEKLLQKCPVISRSLVVAVDDKKHFHGKCAKAYIVLKKGIDPEDALPIIKKHAHAMISNYMRPEEYIFVDRLPTTRSGKLDYFEKAQIPSKKPPTDQCH